VDGSGREQDPDRIFRIEPGHWDAVGYAEGKLFEKNGLFPEVKVTAEIKPYPSAEGFKTILDDLAKKLPAARTANPKDFIDARFIQELDKSGYIDALYR
jgi:hypothetical protein